MTQEEKARAYDEAYKVAEGIHKFSSNPAEIKRMEDLFPELAESEDERVRKALLNEFIHLQSNGYKFAGLEGEEIIDWLEKQGEPSIYDVPSRNIILAVWDLGNNWKELTNGCISTEHGTQLEYIQKHWNESEYYLREKQGEQKKVFKSDEMTTLEDKLSSLVVDAVHIYCKENELDTPHCVGLILGDRLAKEWSKEILESAKKELEEIEQKPTWSEEDEIALGDALWCCKQAASIAKDENDMGNIWYAENWLKSLKERVQPQSQQEWSEEDKCMLDNVIDTLKPLSQTTHSGYAINSMIDWLKSLKPQK